MSRHRAKTGKGRLRRWLGISRAAGSTGDPLPAPRPQLHLLTPHLDSTPVEPEDGVHVAPEACVPFDGRLRPSLVPAEPPVVPDVPAEPAAPEPALDEGAERVLEAVQDQAAAYQAAFLCECRVRARS